MKPTLMSTLLNSGTLLLGMTFASSAVLAQEISESGEIEEVVVTGSFIRNSQFTNASPVETITQDDLYDSGAANLGEYLRTLPYMENIDTVANTFSATDGQQDSNSARFNLRGLGTESTLTLVDGRRAVNESAVAALLPSIVQRSAEIVVDGGAALYGSDAVAGVANLIPYKEFEGLRTRAYYKRDENGDTENASMSLMTGRNFDNGINWVTAFEHSTRTPLLYTERPKYIEPGYYTDNSTSGLPGGFKDFGHVGFIGGNQVRDPSCGTFNEGAEDKTETGNYPSGFESSIFGQPRCGLYFGEWQDIARASDNNTLFNNFTYSPTDWLDLEFQMSHNYRTSTLTLSPSLAPPQGNLDVLFIPADHPANPFGRDLQPTGWRAFGKIGTTPSGFNSNGTETRDYDYYADAYKFGGIFDIADTSWEGEAWIGWQQSRRTYDGYGIPLDRMQAALRGEGGPDGDEYFNPFGSQDVRSPYYEEGVTNNSQELVDWMVTDLKYRDTHDRLKYFDLVFNGEVMELPGGIVRAAVGGQLRHTRTFEFMNPLQAARNNYANDITNPIDVTEDRDSGVRSVFGEVEIPIISSVGVKVAARHEDFYTIGFETTKPKVSLLWEPLETLAVRASYGESFLAPSPRQLRPARLETCTVVDSGELDPLTGQVLDGANSCSSGNPNVGAEESVLRNVGFTWQPAGMLDGLSVSLDYQEIEYFDRIRTQASLDAATADYNRFLQENNLTDETYDPSNPDQLAQALAWAEANPNPLVQREPGTGLVQSVIRAPINIGSQWVEGFDLRVNYSYSTQDLGTFSARLSGNYYTTWEYQTDPESPIIDANGYQNAPTSYAPPIPQYKANLNLSWFMAGHSASVTTRYTDEVIFDTTSITPGGTRPDVIEAITKVDARYSYSFGLFDTDANLTGGITNLFDRDAQRLPVWGGMETRLDDPYGRQYYVSLDVEF